MPLRRVGTSLAAVATAAAVAATLPVHAQAPAAEQGWSVWELTTYKTLTYEAMAQGFDLAAYYVILGGTAAGSAGFFVANAGTAAVAYYTHEIVWDFLGPLPEPYAEWTLATKAATYRVVSVARSFGLGYLIAGDPLAATGFAIAGGIADTAFYVINDYAWSLLAPPPASPR